MRALSQCEGKPVRGEEMVITFVMDQYGDTNNGTTVTAMRFADVLKKKGHEVRILTASKTEGEGIFVLPEWKVPIFHKVIAKEGMKFAWPDEEIIRKAIEGSDVVHMMMPFKAENATRKIAESMHIATTAAFHVQPENLSYGAHLNWVPGFNGMIFRYMKKFYSHYNHIHAPSENTKRILLKHKFTGNIYAISNGVDEAFRKLDLPRPEKYEGKFVILMVGRYASEKRQSVLIKAIGESKYNDKIQLVLAGRGPTEKKLRRLSAKYLKNPAEFTFLPKEALIPLINACDLYVHASNVENEAISCIEAFTCGLVPIISDSDASATKQFALTERNLFPANDVHALAQKIDWFIEHPEEKEKQSRDYIEYAQKFAIEPCVDRLVEVFNAAVDENALRWQNAERETEYLSTLGDKETKRYAKSKKKYEIRLRKKRTPDFTNSFITTVLGDKEEVPKPVLEPVTE